MTEPTPLHSGQTYDHAGAAERITIEPYGAVLRAVFGGETLAESSRALVMHEAGYPPRIYFPPEDVRRELLTANTHTSRCPFKGTASYWDLAAGDAALANGAWAYPDPIAEVAAIKGYLSFYDEVKIEE